MTALPSAAGAVGPAWTLRRRVRLGVASHTANIGTAMNFQKTAKALMTSSERLALIQAELLQPAVSPQVARKHLITLTAMWGDFAAAATEAEIAYATVEKDYLISEEASNRAEKLARATPEYARMRRAKGEEKFVLELIRSCKAAMRSIDEEMRLAR